MLQSVRIGPLREGSRIIGTITVIDDVTERVEREAELQNHQEHLEELVTQRTAELQQTLAQLKQAQAHLVQSEKMSSLGQLVAGVAHEINNPVNFIYANLTHVNQYVKDLLNLIQHYQECYPHPAKSIQALAEDIDLDFIRKDIPKILKSMEIGTERISHIVMSLRNFSRLNEAEMKWVDIHEGLDNTLLILDHRLKSKKLDCPDIQVIKDYGNLPKVQCYAGQLNQVFMNILSNAIEAIEEYNQDRLSYDGTLVRPSDIRNSPNTIIICTEVLADSDRVVIMIGDNGPGMTPEVSERLFEPFFTTKPVGSGTGLGMSISYQIVVQKHRGEVQCISAQGYGTAFLIYLPIKQY
ncbi:MAG TPA: diguanylate cyclase [Cyanobacteria bacterium UBA8803]|nr:diguanylate cyclase [Cyanobacteria bacterium UBA8803]